MRTLSFRYSHLVLATLIAVATINPLFADEPEVVDPVTGETVAISEIDLDTLSDEELADISDQLAEQGVSSRSRSRADLSEVEVVDPTTGETVALGDIDRSSLSDEDRENIGDQLAEQGISVGRHGSRGDTDTDTDSATAASEVDASDDSDTAANEAGDNGRGGRGGDGRGGRGGRD